MFSLSRIQLAKFVALSGLLVFSALGASAGADEMVQRLGPVPPHEPILTTAGNKRIIAFFVPGHGKCDLWAVVWNADDVEAKSASGIRVSLAPGQTTYIDCAANNTFSLRCGYHAETLAAADTDQHFASK